MTATSPSSLRLRARRLARACAGAVAAAVAAASLVVATPAVAADPTPSPSPTHLSGSATLTLSPLDRGVVQADSGLSVYATLDNGTASELDGGTVTLSVGTAPLADRGALSSWLSGTRDGVQLEQVGSTVMPAVASGASTPVLMEVPAPQTARAPGVYPLLATVGGADGSLSSPSVMVVADPAQPQATVGVVVPITAGPLTTGLLTADQLATMTAADGELTAELDAVAGTGAILAIDPAIPAAIRVLGTSAPQTATAWLERLMTLSNPRFALQFGDADIAAQADAGRATLLTPLELSAYLDATNFPTDNPAPTPTPTPTPTSPLPDMKALTDLGTTLPSVYWPFSGTADDRVLTTLTTADRSAVTLVSSASTAQGADNATEPAHATFGNSRALVYDSAISSALGRAASLPDEQHRGSALAEAAANLVFAGKDAAGAPLLVTIDRTGLPDGVGLRDAIDTAFSGALNASFALLTAGDAHSAAFAKTDADTARTTAFTDLESDEEALHNFSSILDEPAVLTGPERAQIMQLLGGGWLQDTSGWKAAVAAHRAKSAKTLESVQVLAPSELLIVSSGADLRFWVRNDLPWAVNVTLHASPDSAKLVVQPTTDVRASGASNTRAVVPVRARVGNGEVTVSLSLRSPTGVEIGTTQTADINVRAEWEAFGIGALAVLVGAFLIIGVIRTLRRRKRQRNQDSPDQDADSPTDADTPTDAPANPVTPHDDPAGRPASEEDDL